MTDHVCPHPPDIADGAVGFQPDWECGMCGRVWSRRIKRYGGATWTEVRGPTIEGDVSHKGRTYTLTTVDMYNLDHACIPLNRAFATHPYLVGTAAQGVTYRDVDVRLILDDEAFDALFLGRPRLWWEILCIALGDYLRGRTGLPIDFQIQRQTEANAQHAGPRSPLGMSRTYAAGGDGTPVWMTGRKEQHDDD